MRSPKIESDTQDTKALSKLPQPVTRACYVLTTFPANAPNAP